MERTGSTSLIKSAASHIPKCLKPKNQSTNGSSSKVCKSLKKSFHSSYLRSKSDNCLHRINNNNYNKVSTSDGTHQYNQPELDNQTRNRSFGQRVANAFASLVLNQSSSVDQADVEVHPNSNQTFHQQHSLRLKPTYSKKATVKKATSLERNINHRITEAEEQARRTRSLERNHRHLVTIDSTCRYFFPRFLIWLR